jgi:hypothetical protein
VPISSGGRSNSAKAVSRTSVIGVAYPTGIGTLRTIAGISEWNPALTWIRLGATAAHARPGC